MTTSGLAARERPAQIGDRDAFLLAIDAPVDAGVTPTRPVRRAPLRAFLENVTRPPLHDRRFWYAQGLVVLVLAVSLVADEAQDAHLIPVPGFVWLLGLFLPVIYAGTGFGFVGSLATALEGAAIALPNELLVNHSSLARWAACSTLVMVCCCALLLGDRFERNRLQQEQRLADERTQIAAHLNGHPLSWRRLLGLLPEGVALLDEHGMIRFVNAQLELLTGHERDMLVGSPVERLIPGSDVADVTGDQATGSSLRSSRSRSLVCRDGGAVPVDILVRPIVLYGARWALVDIRDDRPRREAEAALAAARRREREQAAAASKALAASEQRFRVMFESNMSGIVLVDANDRVLEANPAFCTLVGYSEQELIGNNAHNLTHGRDREKGDRIHAQLLTGAVEQASFTKRYRHKDGHILRVSIQKSAARDETGAVTYFVCSVQDVTNQYQLTTQLNHQARHDPLTGLGNRRLIEERLPRALARARQGEARVALMLLDLDNFKGINDTLGHNAGDELLAAVAQRLRRASRRGDTLARLGGDEFLYLAEGIDGPGDAESLARRLLASLAEPILVSEKRIGQRASLGIAVSGHGMVRDDPAAPVEALLRNADIALYEAKRQGKGRPVLFSCSMQEKVASHFEHAQALSHALASGELSMHYQPIVDLRTGTPTGFEALMRWERPGEGLVPPARFIPLAERSDLILELGGFALREAVSEAAGWPEAGICGAPLRVAVNISPRQLFAPRFASEVRELLATSDLAPDRLVLEVTEGSLLGDMQRAAAILEELAHAGVLVAIDDFGTGHSSFSRLAELRPSILKIDRSFVSPSPPRVSADAMLETMVKLGRRLEMTVIAEGVETVRQRDRLLELGCELGQGFFFSHALPRSELGGMLEASRLSSRRAAGGLLDGGARRPPGN